jgi:sigma-E factor negative regulatory protein RseC
VGKETGKIIRIEEKTMTIQMRSEAHCQFCASKSACVFQGPESMYRFIKVPRKAGYQEGDTVTLEYKESSKIVSALIIFLLPIIFLLLGYLIGYELFGTLTGEILGVIICFLLSVVILYLLNRSIAKSDYFLPKIVHH